MQRSRDAARPLRKDAEHNRALILSAAQELFATQGFDVSLDAVARKAGVGRATLYRNYPDRDALASAIFERNLCALEALSARVKDAPGAFEKVLHAVIEQQIACHALVPALTYGQPAPALAALAARMTRLLRAPLASAKANGEVRDDLRASDVLSVIAMLSASFVACATERERRKRAKRAFDLLLSGLVPR